MAFAKALTDLIWSRTNASEVTTSYAAAPVISLSLVKAEVGKERGWRRGFPQRSTRLSYGPTTKHK